MAGQRQQYKSVGISLSLSFCSFFPHTTIYHISDLRNIQNLDSATLLFNEDSSSYDSVVDTLLCCRPALHIICIDNLSVAQFTQFCLQHEHRSSRITITIKLFIFSSSTESIFASIYPKEASETIPLANRRFQPRHYLATTSQARAPYHTT